MVSYHTPKIYRSTFGCCICRAKSSSSRFTDSSRYESEFHACFRLDEPRYGEICNACVLLIKRYKKLPPGTKKHWNHVVDARARPRGRSQGRSDVPHSSSYDSMSFFERSPSIKMKKHRYIRKVEREISYESEDQYFCEDALSEISGNSVSSSRVQSPCNSPYPLYQEDETTLKYGSSRRKQQKPKKLKLKDFTDFIDHEYWKKEEICCGQVFKGAGGELLIDPQLLKRCSPEDMSSYRNPTSGGGETTPQTTSEAGSCYGDEPDSPDEDASNEPFYRSSVMEASLLTEFAAALVT